MRRGIHLEGKKDASRFEWTIHRPYPPSRVLISLSQAEGPPPIPCVRSGDCVRLGEEIASPSHENAVALHASLAGRVAAIGTFPHPLLGESEGIAIEAEEPEQVIPQWGIERNGWQDMGPEELERLFQQTGLLDLSPEGKPAAGRGRLEGIPLHRKTASARRMGKSTLLVSGCDPEPYLAASYCLMMSHPVEILKGAEILRRAACAGRVILALTEDQLQAAELMRSKIYFLKWNHFEVKLLPDLYPLAWEEVRVPDSQALFCSVDSAFAAYEAVALQKPFCERVVTVGGECTMESKNFWVRIGTPFQELIHACRGFLREPSKVLAGGPMTGEPQSSLEAPVLKTTPALLALPAEVARPAKVLPCIRCGLCLEVCPVEISPAMITLAAESDLFDLAREYGLGLCTECGNCTYICPSQRPMVELIRYAASQP